jgi:hypothetical protein
MAAPSIVTNKTPAEHAVFPGSKEARKESYDSDEVELLRSKLTGNELAAKV